MSSSSNPISYFRSKSKPLDSTSTSDKQTPTSTSVNPHRNLPSSSASPSNPNRSRSRGQLQRKHSTTRASSAKHNLSNLKHGSNLDNPPLGGLFWTDFVVLGFTYTLNLIRTCGIAELFDVAFKAFVYVGECRRGNARKEVGSISR